MGVFSIGVAEEIKKNLSEYKLRSPRYKPDTSMQKIRASSVGHFVRYFKFKPGGIYSDHGALEV
jgi:hypothetical protein